MNPRRLDWRAVESRLVRIGELLDTLDEEAGLITSELATALRPSAGTRNVLVHGYLDVDHVQVAAAVPLALRDYREYVRQAARWMRDRTE